MLLMGYEMYRRYRMDRDKRGGTSIGALAVVVISLNQSRLRVNGGGLRNCDKSWFKGKEGSAAILSVSTMTEAIATTAVPEVPLAVKEDDRDKGIARIKKEYVPAYAHPLTTGT
jgi:hypothetical protein